MSGSSSNSIAAGARDPIRSPLASPAPSPNRKGSAVRVFVRVRPVNEREKDGKASVCVKVSPQSTVSVVRRDRPVCTYQLDGVLWSSFTAGDTHAVGVPFADQAAVYEQVGAPLVTNTLIGYNSCLFAYGQTGSGKTFTMMGERDDAELSGVIPRLCRDLFARIEKLQRDSPELSFAVSVSYMELYLEQSRDLLDPDRDSLRVRQHPIEGVFVEGLSTVSVADVGAVLSLMKRGEKSRHTAATKMNLRSSRSHAIFTVHFQSAQLVGQAEPDEAGSALRAKLNLVDLAGSERVNRSGAEGTQLSEATNINLSLTTLGRVIDALADRGSRRGAGMSTPPYRDSQLTWILSDSLGGNSKTCMIATVSPHVSSVEETQSTLRYASRAREIVNMAVVNEDPRVRRIRELVAQNERFKAEMIKLRDKRFQQQEEVYATVADLQAEVERLQKELADERKRSAALLAKVQELSSATPASPKRRSARAASSPDGGRADAAAAAAAAADLKLQLGAAVQRAEKADKRIAFLEQTAKRDARRRSSSEGTAASAAHEAVTRERQLREQAERQAAEAMAQLKRRRERCVCGGAQEMQKLRQRLQAMEDEARRLQRVSSTRQLSRSPSAEALRHRSPSMDRAPRKTFGGAPVERRASMDRCRADSEAVRAQTAERKAADLAAEVDLLRSSNSDLTGQLSAGQQTREQLKERIRAVSADLEEAHATGREDKRRARLAEGDARELRAELQQLKCRFSELHGEHDEAVQRVTALRLKARETDSAADALRKDLKSTESARQALETELESVRAQVRRMESVEVDLRAELAAAQSTAVAAQAAVTEESERSRADASSQHARVCALESEALALRRQVDAANAQSREAAAALSAEASTRSEVETSLRRELAAAQARSQEAAAELKADSSARSELESEATSLRRELAAAQARSQEAAAELKAESSSRSETESQLRGLQAELERSAARSQETTAELESERGARSELQSQLASLRSELAAAKVRSLETSETATAERAALEHRLAAVQADAAAEKEELHARVEGMRAEVTAAEAASERERESAAEVQRVLHCEKNQLAAGLQELVPLVGQLRRDLAAQRSLQGEGVSDLQQQLEEERQARREVRDANTELQAQLQAVVEREAKLHADFQRELQIREDECERLRRRYQRMQLRSRGGSIAADTDSTLPASFRCRESPRSVLSPVSRPGCSP
eukprot:TRINITY_DN3203_c0_g2_i1.p1 TRINITY_DN3203_c0_g2~~TRINITY_DN3203_c0_g2_i1.p1  ORF type:complete len:1205 (+),score=501.04 TRINITY_DN3203_c0_g2_i1:83-3697(+)